MLPQAQSDASANHWVDLLTGGDTVPESIPQPVMGNVMYKGDDLLDFLDESLNDDHHAKADSKLSTIQDGRPIDSGAQQYINCLKAIAGPYMVC